MSFSPFQRRFKSRRPRRLGPRDRILREWRGVDVRALEKTHGSKSYSAGAVVKNVLAALQLDRRRAETEVVKVWNQTIDPTITSHAQPDKHSSRHTVRLRGLERVAGRDRALSPPRDPAAPAARHGQRDGQKNLVPNRVRFDRSHRLLFEQRGCQAVDGVGFGLDGGFEAKLLEGLGGLGADRCKLEAWVFRAALGQVEPGVEVFHR